MLCWNLNEWERGDRRRLRCMLSSKSWGSLAKLGRVRLRSQAETGFATTPPEMSREWPGNCRHPRASPLQHGSKKPCVLNAKGTIRKHLTRTPISLRKVFSLLLGMVWERKWREGPQISAQHHLLSSGLEWRPGEWSSMHPSRWIFASFLSFLVYYTVRSTGVLWVALGSMLTGIFFLILVAMYFNLYSEKRITCSNTLPWAKILQSTLNI